jgi:hypothetical protein
VNSIAFAIISINGPALAQLFEPLHYLLLKAGRNRHPLKLAVHVDTRVRDNAA